jgi:hypothetical protein
VYLRRDPQFENHRSIVYHLTDLALKNLSWSRSFSSFMETEASFFPLKVGVGQTQAWMPTYVSILRIPQMIWVWRATVEWYWQGKTEELGEKPVPVPLCPPQIPHGLTRARNWASAVRGRRLTTWATARPRSFVTDHWCLSWVTWSQSTHTTSEWSNFFLPSG